MSNNNTPSISMLPFVFVLQEHLELKLFANRPCHRAAAFQVNVTIYRIPPENGRADAKSEEGQEFIGNPDLGTPMTWASISPPTAVRSMVT